MSLPSKVTAFLLTIFLALLFVEGCTSMQPPGAEAMNKLRPGPNESLAMVLPAGGVQIYECHARKDRSGEYEWMFVAPEADLYDGHGAKVGSHYAGPHWESGDGSRIAGTLKERADAPQAGAIPWLLLAAKSVGPEGSMSRVTSVQRLHTVGGVAPQGGCSDATAGKQVRVSYTADYYFFTPSHPAAPASQSAGMY
ncbi:MAG TPA: DUF3455 domain-containing protein [Burkholderiales bacterium]|nr:DUF3455 domain-containing protein [Burkholderiales bacterium]